jgi:transcriptional regulator with XRE-family HTH domain
MRDAFLSAQTRTKLANQIRTIRSHRGWSQGEFARILGKPQSNVSRMESRDYGNFSLSTLFELAFAFDCGLVVEFVPFADFLVRTHDLSPAALNVQSFDRTALLPLCQDMPFQNQSNISQYTNITFVSQHNIGNVVTNDTVEYYTPVSADLSAQVGYLTNATTNYSTSCNYAQLGGDSSSIQQARFGVARFRQALIEIEMERA